MSPIASSLTEMKQINPGFTGRQLFRSGMNVGKDIMGTMTNTLILTFTGSSMNIILIYYMYAMPDLGLIHLDLLGRALRAPRVFLHSMRGLRPCAFL